jgi:hypothetical protein
VAQNDEEPYYQCLVVNAIIVAQDPDEKVPK